MNTTCITTGAYPSPDMDRLTLTLVALQTATGAVTFLVTRHPGVQLAHLGTQLEIARSLVVTTPHAERIARQLEAEFAGKALSTYGDHPYFLVDWEFVEQALAEFDLVTGRRLRMGDVAVGDAVRVTLTLASEPERKLRGYVTAIAGRRFAVKLDRPDGELHSLLATRAQLKPILRAVAAA